MDANDWLGDVDAAPERDEGGRPPSSGTNRQVKVACASCGFKAWTTRASLERGRPECCGVPLELPRLADRAAVEWDVLAVELQAMPVERDRSGKVIRDPYAEALAELGYSDMKMRVSKYGAGGAVNRRCEASGCHKFVAGRYCPEHENERRTRRRLRKLRQRTGGRHGCRDVGSHLARYGRRSGSRCPPMHSASKTRSGV